MASLLSRGADGDHLGDLVNLAVLFGVDRRHQQFRVAALLGEEALLGLGIGGGALALAHHHPQPPLVFADIGDLVDDRDLFRAVGLSRNSWRRSGSFLLRPGSGSWLLLARDRGLQSFFGESRAAAVFLGPAVVLAGIFGFAQLLAA